jgi:hypothetical protein
MGKDRDLITCKEHLLKAEDYLEHAELKGRQGNHDSANLALNISRQHLRLAQAKAGDGSV